MNSPGNPVRISDELKDWIEGGVSVLVGTRDAAMVPEITRAWGPQVRDDRNSLSLCVPLATSHKTLDNIANNGRIAVIFALPTTIRSVQLKGTCVETATPDATDLAAVERHREVFAAGNERIGVPRHRVETLWRRELETSPILVKLRCLVEEAFDQTPGPGAGAPL
jgi:hypothetical protein